MRRLGGYQQVYGFTSEMIEGDPETGGLLAPSPRLVSGSEDIVLLKEKQNWLI